MNLSIKGKLSKINDEWISEFGQLGIRIKGPTAFQSIQAMNEFIMSKLEGTDIKCSILLDEGGVFYLSTNRPRPLIKFMALHLTKSYNDMSYEQLNEWFKVEDEH